MFVRPSWRVVPFFLATALSGACDRPASADGASPSPPTIAIVDADGRPIQMPGPAERIVSLVPSATLTLQALGAQGRIVARTDFDTVSWARDLPSVGGGIEPSMEAIVAARPDLVIRFGGPQDPRTPTRLDELGIRHVAIRPDRIADVLETIRLLGTVTGRDAAAASLVQSIRDTLDEIRRRTAEMPSVRVAYVLGGTPPWVAGPGTYIDELIRLAGGVNVFSDLDRLYGAVSPEEFVARKIDVIIAPPGDRYRRLAPGARLAEAGPAMELPGPGVVEAALQMEEVLHPRDSS